MLRGGGRIAVARGDRAPLRSLDTADAARLLEDPLDLRLGWKGWRDITNEVRLRRAILLLSNGATPIAEIASVTGYGSSDALATAFRRSGLPPPRDVRAIVLSGVSPAV